MAGSNIQAIYRLSPLQEGILYHCLRCNEQNPYFQQYHCLLTALKDMEAWRSAWLQVVQRHPVARTVFAWEKRDNPLQIVRKSGTLPWVVEDWRKLDQQRQESLWRERVESDRQQGFELNKSPLMRFRLCLLDEDVARFLWSFHHIILDGWSQRLMMRDALAIYRAVMEGTKSCIPQPGSYEDFIRWREGIDQDSVSRFWKERLNGFGRPTLLARPNGGLTRQSDDTRNGSIKNSLAAPQVAKLLELARAEQVTLNTLVSACWALVVARQCDSNDIVFGATVSGRPVNLPRAEDTAGLFINTLPVRVVIDPAAALEEWLRSLQMDQTAALEHQQISLVDIQRSSEIPVGHSLFDSILVYENLPQGFTGQSNGKGPVLEGEHYIEFSHYPLAILVEPGEEMTFHAIYQPRAVSLERAQSLLGQLLDKLSYLAEGRVSTVGDIARVFRPACSVSPALAVDNAYSIMLAHHWVEQVAVHNPGQIALIQAKKVMNYVELNATANRLAHYLAERGVTSGDIVPLLLERSVEAIIAQLAVLKSGAAYAMLDTREPSDRLQEMLVELADHGRLLITEAELERKLPKNGFDSLVLELEHEKILKMPPHNRNVQVHSNDLAYVVYTSGSTGRPRGVMVEHGSLIASTWARDAFYPQPPRAFLLLSSLSTDSSVAGIYWAQCNGASLVLAPPRIEQDMEELRNLIQSSCVSHLLCVPSLYRLMIDFLDPSVLNQLDSVILAGEACPSLLVAQHRIQNPGVHIYNEYGPSEATVWCAASDLSQWREGDTVTIGRPVTGYGLHIVNTDLQPVPIGAAGELLIEGRGVARGYLGDSASTALRFVQLPLGGGNSRMYRSGDRVRMLEDGNIEYLGREDNQIKVRGFRVEPEEIEKVLLEMDDVLAAAVYLEPIHPDEKELEKLALQLESLGAEEAGRILELAESGKVQA